MLTKSEVPEYGQTLGKGRRPVSRAIVTQAQIEAARWLVEDADRNSRPLKPSIRRLAALDDVGLVGYWPDDTAESSNGKAHLNGQVNGWEDKAAE